MIEFKQISVDFPDEKDVEVLSLRISGTYSGSFEGTCRSVSIHQICDFLAKAKEGGFYFRLSEEQLTAEEQVNMPQHWKEREREKEKMYLAEYKIETQVLQPNDVLKPYCYNLSIQDKNHNSLLTMVGFDEAPNLNMSLNDIILPHIQSINYHDFARKIDCDNF